MSEEVQDTQALTASPSPSPADLTSAAPRGAGGPARYGLPSIDPGSHTLAALWTFPGGGAVFRPPASPPTGVLPPDQALAALQQHGADPAAAQAFLALYEPSSPASQPATAWLAVWTGAGGPGPPPPPPGAPTPFMIEPPTTSLTAVVIDAASGAPLQTLIASR